MRIVFLPLHSYGAADLDSGTVFVSNRISTHNSISTLTHELGHLIRNNPDHDNRWLDCCHNLDPLFTFKHIGNVPIGHVGNIALNIGNISGIQNILVDYHLLQAYRKFSQRILGTEGQWEYVKSSGQLGGDKIRLFPIPKGTYPVIIEYIPSVEEFTSPQARELTYRAVLAQAKMMIGSARRKFSGIPSPDGGTITFDGESMYKEGAEEYKEIIDLAIGQSEPLGIYLW